MTRSGPSPFLPSASVMVVALALAACGGGGTSTAAAPKTSGGASATVGVANSSLGSILVDSSGRTVYLFEADSGIKSACRGACATAWPPLLAKGTPTAGTGLTAPGSERLPAPAAPGKSPTTATRSTFTSATRSPAMSTGRASPRSAPPGMSCHQPAKGSLVRSRARRPGPPAATKGGEP
jgi:hypothetical protein